MLRIHLLGFVSLFLIAFAARAQEPPRTVAETSDFKETSKHADVIAFCEQLAKLAPDAVRLSEFGTSGEGRKMPLLILAEPAVATPAEAAKSGKLLLFIQANIHAGEVDGKEGVLMLAREIALAKQRPLLKDLIIAIVPDINPDGNERFAAHRPLQNGPPQVGTRENAAGLDLNRDFVKLDSPEIRAMLHFCRYWDPAVIIDMHTTNGSHHRYPLTFDCPRHPAIADELVSFGRDVLLPDAAKRLEKATGFPSFFYGNFNRAHTQWNGVEALPRYGTQYVGFRSRLAILSESYSYSPFKQRVTASQEFARACCEAVAAHEDKIRELIKSADKPGEQVALSHKLAARERQVTVLGFEESIQDGKRIVGAPRDYTVTQIDVAEAANRVARPAAYLFSPRLKEVVENLQRHGIVVEALSEDIELECQADVVEKIAHAARRYQNHTLVTLTASPGKVKTKRFPAGTIVVRTAQRLGTLVVFLLEAQSEDGLVTWNYFDSELKEGQEYPVARVTKDVPIKIARVPALAEDRGLDQ